MVPVELAMEGHKEMIPFRQKKSHVSIIHTVPEETLMDDFILEGPTVGPVPDCSLGQYFIPKLRALPKDHIIQVDADTGETQTVEEFLRLGISFAVGLKKKGLSEGDVIGMICNNCFEASAVVFGAWLSGVPITVAAGGMKVVEMKRALELTRPKIIFCEEEELQTVTTAAGMMSPPPNIILIDCKENRHQNLTFQDFIVSVDPDSFTPSPVSCPATHLAMILFSSGTSGLPKAVGLTHKNLIFQGLVREGLVGLTKENVCLQVSHFFWVTALLMFVQSLLGGCRRVLVRKTNAGNVLKAMEKYKTNWTVLAPPILKTIIDHPLFPSTDVTSMKKLYIGGDMLTPAVIDKVKAKWPNIRLIQTYGTTEAGGVILSTVKGEDITSVGSVSPGLQLKIVDVNTGKPVGAKSLGEICVKSPGIMFGYLGNEEATRKAIDPEGWCHTGDLGYYDDLKQVFLVDRITEIIMLMPHRVSPVEVEGEILKLVGVSEVAVAVVHVTPDLRKLTALVVRSKGSKVMEKEIVDHVANTLSDYKALTGGVFFVEELPKTASGKLHRKEVKKLAESLFFQSST